MVYLDNAANTKIDPEVLEAMVFYLKQEAYNPSSTHSLGRKAKVVIEQSRRQIAEILGIYPNDIIFTSGATEAHNLIISTVLTQYGIKKIFTTAIEHPSVLNTILYYSKKLNIELVYLPLNQNGQIKIDFLTTIITTTKEPTLISIFHGHNEIGIITPLDKIAFLCKDNPLIYFHSDTVQSIGHIPMLLPKGLDFCVASAHKFHGPQGIGMAIVRKTDFRSFHQIGGSQERLQRGGTENIPGIYGMAIAFKKYSQNDTSYIKSYMIKSLKKAIPQVIFNGDSDSLTKSLASILSVRLPIKKNVVDILFELDRKGIAASSSSACASGVIGGSYVLKELKIPQDQPNLRFSFSKYTSTQEIDICINVLQKIISN